MAIHHSAGTGLTVTWQCYCEHLYFAHESPPPHTPEEDAVDRATGSERASIRHLCRVLSGVQEGRWRKWGDFRSGYFEEERDEI